MTKKQQACDTAPGAAPGGAAPGAAPGGGAPATGDAQGAAIQYPAAGAVPGAAPGGGAPASPESIDYRSAGVDVAAGRALVEEIDTVVAATHGPDVLGGLGGFAALYALTGYHDPVLVSGTDGVGTKLEVARAAGRYDTIGIDLVAMCVNDVVCHGARPLFFLDYMAVDRLDAVDAAAIVSGVAEGCRLAGCALVGGETAEMPGVYRPGRFDLAGFAVGAVERRAIVDGRNLSPGMKLVGLASSGFHSNGYSLLRRLFPRIETSTPETSADDLSLRDALLTPTRIYAAAVEALMRRCSVAGIAHVTGGGWWENIPRLLGSRRGELGVLVDAAAVKPAPVFRILHDTAVTPQEAYHTFNMGLGLVVAVPEREVATAIDVALDVGIEAWPVGEVISSMPNTSDDQRPDGSTTDGSTTNGSTPSGTTPRDVHVANVPSRWDGHA